LIAEQAARRGAEVALVSGPTDLPDPFGCTVVRVTSAEEMFAAAKQAFGADSVAVSLSDAAIATATVCPSDVSTATAAVCPPDAAIATAAVCPPDAPTATATMSPPDAAIFTAAVADFRPAKRSEQKLKKAASGSETTLQLVANPDILATLAANKKSTYVVGFAAETENVVESAGAKLTSKNADLIVANDVSDPTLGFATSQNRWHFVSKSGVESTDILHKKILAGLLLDKVAQAIEVRQSDKDSYVSKAGQPDETVAAIEAC
jgi:phosphopantothenoylcysteine decarboxylase/phosphopantothenate--cysteine ligase